MMIKKFNEKNWMKNGKNRKNGKVIMIRKLPNKPN